MNTNDIEDVYELSPLQQGILFHSLAAPDAGVYLIRMAYTLQGRLDVGAFARAWQRVADRNAILRTSFHHEGLDKPLQVVHRRVDLSLTHHDWRTLGEDEREARLRAWTEDEHRRPVRLDPAPLTRIALVRTGNESYRFFWTFHHILMEGWSASLLLDEVFTFYRAFRDGADPTLPARRAYRDYFLWVQQQDPAAAEAYWRRSLEGFRVPTSLRVERPLAVEGAPSDAYGRRQRRLPAGTDAALRAFVRRHQLTLNTVIQGAWALLLSRYSGEQDVLFGSVVSGREGDLEGIDSMVGLFVNTLPARVRVPPAVAVVPWLKALQGQLADMRRHEHSSLIQIQGWSDVPRGQAMFESLVIFENWAGDATLARRDEGFAVTHVDYAEGGTACPLVVEVLPGPPLSVQFVYDRQHFEGTVVERMLGHWVNLLDAATAHPDAPLASLSLFDPDERGAVLSLGRGARTDYPRNSTVPDLFESQAARKAESVAAVFEGESITYGELERRANRLARVLVSKGAGRGTRVALFLERSLDLPVAMLGVLKAGAAYVPLDPAQPAERLALMLEDAETQLVVTQERLRGGWTGAGMETLSIDSAEVESADASPVERGIDADDVAYVIYTSGSTGRPKGVQIGHGALSNALLALGMEPGISEEDVVLALTTISFDIAGLELLLPLLVGARVVIVGRETALDGRRLAETLERSGVTVMQATPATWRVLLESGWGGRGGLKALCGGEAFPAELARELLPRCGSLWNLYGPTEATIWSSVQRVEDAGGTIPLGRPIANMQHYVLDRYLEPVPPGVAGELYIGGAQLARGYWKAPDLTAWRFVPDPFAAEPGRRLYRTGDLVRQQPEGGVEFLGRIDHQIKIRGFRVELGEIETVLRRHPAVQDAVVAMRDDGPGGPSMVAYFVARGPENGFASELAGFLRERLPDYMVPSTFMRLQSLPLTPNGKVDRRALPAPDGARPELVRTFVAPRTDEEKEIAAIWRDVLRLDRVGVHDNFFDLGGHSLLLIQAHGRVRESFPGQALPVIDLFRLPTIAALAAHLAGAPVLEPAASRMAEGEVDARAAGRQRLGRRREVREALLAGDDLDA